MTTARTLKRTKVSHLKRGQAPFEGGPGSWKTNARPVYVRRIKGQPSVIRLAGGHGWTNSMTDAELALARRVAVKHGWTLVERRADITLPSVERWQHLDGDLDCDPDLLDRLDLVGADLGVTVFVRSGRRTMEEQWALYRQLGPTIAAYPSATAPHVRGIAADTGINGRDIGDYPGAREAMKRHGLCLRVPGEDWHVEVGTVWAA